MELNEELKASVRDLGEVAGRSEAQAVNIAESRTRQDMLAGLLGLLTQGATLRDLAADLYVRVDEWDGEA